MMNLFIRMFGGISFRGWGIFFVGVGVIAGGILFIGIREEGGGVPGRGSSGEGSAFAVRIDAKVVRGVDDNLSGLCFDYDQGVLLAVVNTPAELLILDLEGEVLRRYPLDGFGDTEGIAYLGDGYAAILEERRQNVVVVRLSPEEGPIFYSEANHFPVPRHAQDNKSFEGIHYDRAKGRLLLVRESQPLAIYSIPDFSFASPPSGAVEMEDFSYLLTAENLMLMEDLSSVSIHPGNGNLILLSDDSKRLLEINEDTAKSRSFSLRRGAKGLGKSIPQAEGVAFDLEGNLYVVSEPSLFYAFDFAVTKP